MSEIVNGEQLAKNGSKKTHVKQTTFEQVFHQLRTYIFGLYNVENRFNGIAADKTTQRVSTDINTYTLKAPLLTPITMNKVYSQVPRQAILPNAWEKIYTNPSIGDDIDATRYGTSIKAETWNGMLIKTILSLQTIIDDLASEGEEGQQPTPEQLRTGVKILFESLIRCEYIFSAGSLLNNLGCKMNTIWIDKNIKYNDRGKKWDFDTYFEEVCNIIYSVFSWIIFEKDENLFALKGQDWETTPQFTKAETVTIDEVLNWYREGEELKIQSVVVAYEEYSNLTLFQDVKFTRREDDVYYTKPVDIAPLWAYQLICAEFFTNDKVDYIYNAEMFRQYIKNLFIQWCEDNNMKYDQIGWYTYNGIKIEIDALSAEVFSNIMLTSSNVRPAYYTALFAWKRSLKYKDYFTGARTRPVAIGNTEIEVNDNIVEVIDVVKNIQKQRFINIVNKIPRDIKGYTKGIFGKDVAPDWHNPLFLVRTRETIYGQETENTGTDQFTKEVSRTMVLRNQGKNIQINFTLDRNSIILGIVYFDIPRSYTKGVNRDFMHVDRFDYFNPYLQYCGDQEIYGEELDANFREKFAYTGAYMEYKLRYNEAFGGFQTALPGWTFSDAFVDGKQGYYVIEGEPVLHISPDFIRSKPTELDRFYLKLSGHSLANRFHFIADNTIYLKTTRPMAYNPQILG